MAKETFVKELAKERDDHFQDEKPKGAEVEVDDPAFAADLSA